MTKDESLKVLTGYIRDKEPFTFSRFGDGDIQFMFNLRDGRTADGERNSPELSEALRRAWSLTAPHPKAMVGDFLSCGDFGPGDEQLHKAEWDLMCRMAPPRRLLHVEAPLMTKLSPALLEFWAAIQRDERPKLLVANIGLRRAALDLVDGDFHAVETGTAFATVGEHCFSLDRDPAEVILFCAGRTSKVIISELLARNPDRTYIDIGSGLDPLYLGKTRSVQATQAQALEYFGGLMGAKKDAYRNLDAFHDIAEGMNLRYALIDGTLLGMVRDGDLCPGDEDDIDIGIEDAQWHRTRWLVQFLKAVGFKLVDTFEHHGKPEGLKLKRGKSHFDIVRVHQSFQAPEAFNLGRITEGPNRGKVIAFVYPDRHCFGDQQILWRDRMWWIPYDPEGLLTARYGDWRTPIPRSEFNWYEQSNRASIREDYEGI